MVYYWVYHKIQKSKACIPLVSVTHNHPPTLSAGNMDFGIATHTHFLKIIHMI